MGSLVAEGRQKDEILAAVMLARETIPEALRGDGRFEERFNPRELERCLDDIIAKEVEDNPMTSRYVRNLWEAQHRAAQNGSAARLSTPWLRRCRNRRRSRDRPAEIVLASRRCAIRRRSTHRTISNRRW